MVNSVQVCGWSGGGTWSRLKQGECAARVTATLGPLTAEGSWPSGQEEEQLWHAEGDVSRRR